MDARSLSAGPPAGATHGAWTALRALLAAGLFCAAPVQAQEAGSPATAFFEGSLAVTTVQGDVAGMGGGAILLGVNRRLSLGGAGAFMFGHRRLPGPGPGSDLDLRMAYGGVVAQWLVLERGERNLWVRALAGVGNGSVDLAVVGTEIAADNFGVYAPELGGSMTVRGPLLGGASVGYRGVFGAGDLPGVTPADLRGPFVRAHLTYRLF